MIREDNSKITAACAVLFVRVTPSERDQMHDFARKQNVSLNSYLRSVLGLPTRRGYRPKGATNATQEISPRIEAPPDPIAVGPIHAESTSEGKEPSGSSES
jgi:hypothetical protein